MWIGAFCVGFGWVAYGGGFGWVCRFAYFVWFVVVSRLGVWWVCWVWCFCCLAGFEVSWVV